jgi:hypothetical protein
MAGGGNRARRAATLQRDRDARAWANQQQSEAMHERPKDQDRRGDSPLISQCLRKRAPQGALSDRVREKGLRLLSAEAHYGQPYCILN